LLAWSGRSPKIIRTLLRRYGTRGSDPCLGDGREGLTFSSPDRLSRQEGDRESLFTQARATEGPEPETFSCTARQVSACLFSWVSCEPSWGSSSSVPPLGTALRLSGHGFQLPWRQSERKDAKLAGQEPEVLRGSRGSHRLSRSSSETSRSLGVSLRSVPARGASWVRCRLGHARASAWRCVVIESETPPAHRRAPRGAGARFPLFRRRAYPQLLAAAARGSNAAPA